MSKTNPLAHRRSQVMNSGLHDPIFLLGEHQIQTLFSVHLLGSSHGSPPNDCRVTFLSLNFLVCKMIVDITTLKRALERQSLIYRPWRSLCAQ